MAQYVCNVAKGRANELHERARTGDPANAAIVIVAISSTDTVESIKDAATLADILALTNTAEVTNTGYARKALSGTALNALSIDNTSNTQTAGFVNNQTWTTVAAGDNWTHLVFCYDSDTTASTDANIIPLTFHDFAKTPDGSDIVLQAGNYFQAGE
jgi:hypothetical protein